MQIVPNVSHILSCFKILSTRLLALQCSKKFTNPITLDSILTTSQKYDFIVHQIATSGTKLNFFGARTLTDRIHQNAISGEKDFLRGPSPLPKPLARWGAAPLPISHTSPLPSLLDAPLRPLELQPDMRHCRLSAILCLK